MTTKTPSTKPHRGKLKLTQARVVEGIMFAIETDGVEKAKLLFDMLNTYYSTEPGWPETALEIRKLFAEIRKQEEQRRHAEKEAKRELDRLKATTPSTLITNNNEAKSIGQADVDMDIDVKCPGNTIARTIKIDRKDDE